MKTESVINEGPHKLLVRARFLAKAAQRMGQLTLAEIADTAIDQLSQKTVNDKMRCEAEQSINYVENKLT